MAKFDFFKKWFPPKNPSDLLPKTLNEKGLNKTEVDQILFRLTSYSPEQLRLLFRTNEGLLGTSQEKYLRYGYVRPQTLNHYARSSFNLANTLMSIWSSAVTGRFDYLKISAEMRMTYIVDAILDVMSADVLNADEKGECIVFASKHGHIQRELDWLMEKYNFHALLHEIIKDLIDWGEYTLKLNVVPGVGITAINDDQDPLNVIAFYEQGFPVKFLTQEEGEFWIKPAYEYAHFVIGSNKLRIKFAFQNMQGLSVADIARNTSKNNEWKLPDYIRTGKPLFYSQIDKVRELQVLEKLMPAAKINQITQSHLVKVKVPAATPQAEVQTILDRYEDILNMPMGIDFDRDQLTLAEIMTATGKMRVVPEFDDGKGTLEPLNVREYPPIDDILHSIQDIRRVIMGSLGLPVSMLFGGEEPDQSGELRRFSRYTRKLADIQKDLINGLKQIILTHLINKGVEVNHDDIDVYFKQSLVDLSSLEKLEMDDAKQEIVGRTIDFLDKAAMNPNIQAQLNPKGVNKWLKTKFATLTDGETLFLEEPQHKQLGMDTFEPPNKDVQGDRLPADNQDDFASGDPLESPSHPAFDKQRKAERLNSEPIINAESIKGDDIKMADIKKLLAAAGANAEQKVAKPTNEDESDGSTASLGTMPEPAMGAAEYEDDESDDKDPDGSEEKDDSKEEAEEDVNIDSLVDDVLDLVQDLRDLRDCQDGEESDDDYSDDAVDAGLNDPSEPSDPEKPEDEEAPGDDSMGDEEEKPRDRSTEDDDQRDSKLAELEARVQELESE